MICAFTMDRWADIARALTALADQTVAPSEVVFVSDYNDELLARVQESFPGVVAVPNARSKGLSGARNTGVERTTADIVAFLDDDACPARDWVERLSAAYDADDIVGVGGRVLPDWRTRRPAWLPEEFFWVVGCSYIGQPQGRATVRNAIGANMSFRRRAFEDAGGFDERLGRLGKDAAGCEETEFSIRLRALDVRNRIVLDPAVSCIHSVTAERAEVRYFRRRCRAEGKSKALISVLCGAESALESERAYVARVLPAGVVRGVLGVLRGDLRGPARAWFIVEGLALTAYGYATTKIRLRRNPPTVDRAGHALVATKGS